jgi:hypothetical protein
LEVPGGVQEFLESDGFERALGVELLSKGGFESGEFLPVFIKDDEVARSESMACGIARDARFACGSARSGGR